MPNSIPPEEPVNVGVGKPIRVRHKKPTAACRCGVALIDGRCARTGCGAEPSRCGCFITDATHNPYPSEPMPPMPDMTTNLAPQCPAGCNMTIASFCSYCAPVMKRAADEAKAFERERIKRIIEAHAEHDGVADIGIWAHVPSLLAAIDGGLTDA